MSDWTVYCRDPAFQRVGIIDDYMRLEAVPTFNDVGTWQLEMDARAPLAPLLAQPKYGIELVRNSDDVTVFSGSVTNPVVSKKDGARTLTAAGQDDNQFLNYRITHPSPSATGPSPAPEYRYPAAYDNRSGTASTVIRGYVDANLGPSATAARRLPFLVLPSDPLVGTSVSGKGRFQSLLEIVQEMATAGGVGFRLHQVGLNVQLDVYLPEDKTGTVVFSDELGNLGDYSYGQEISEGNYIFVGGQGEGQLRGFREGQDSVDVGRWRRIERFEDRRDSNEDGDLQQEVGKTLAETANKYTLEFTPLHTESLQYRRDYDLGDKATVEVEGVRISEVIRSVRIEVSPDSGTQVTPSLDTPGKRTVFKLFRRLRQAERRIRHLERR